MSNDQTVNMNQQAQPGPEIQPPVGPDDATPADQNELAKEADQLRTDLERFKDLALRAHADLDNYRKRVAREMEDERRYGTIRLLRDLLPVVDNLKRAIEASEKLSEAGGLLEGVKMVVKQIEGVLEQHRCTRIDALHKPFDPAHHQAILQQPSADHPPNTVIHVAQEGYQLHDRVVRPSQVIVSSAPAPVVSPDGRNR